MITAEATTEGTCLRVDCVGTWEYDSGGTRCGHLVRNTIQRGMSEATTAITEIVIDFTKVNYLGGDGPGWSVLGKTTRGVKITYLAGEQSGQGLQELFAVTRLETSLISITIGSFSSAMCSTPFTNHLMLRAWSRRILCYGGSSPRTQEQGNRSQPRPPK